ncbi:MAG: hypothetical protein OXT69_11975 [Candidatus Poribacteria bacterium]|nr:hypothetical protein [Candidatus Poribacteria bacterium]
MNIIGKIASVLLAAGWLLSLNGCGRWADDNEDQIEKRDSTAQSINGLRPEDQTPRYRPAPDASESLTEGEGAPALQQKESADFQPAYDFKTWEDALVAYAHLVGLEYEQVKKEGLKTKWNRPPSPKTVRIFMAHEAAGRVFKRFYDENKYPELKAAIMPFHKDVPEAEWDSVKMLERIGKLPASDLRNEIKLPNGKMYDLKENTELVVKFQKRGKLSESGKRALAAFKERKAELLKQLDDSPSESERESINEELEWLRPQIENLSGKGPLFDFVRRYGFGNPNDPNIKVIEMDLGVIERSD